MSNYYNRQWRLPNNENKDKQSNYSLSFDGNNQYIDLGNSTEVQPVKEISISAWINASSLATYRGIVSCMYNGSSYDGFALRLDDTSSNKIQFVVNSSTQIKSTSTITTGQWYHLVATYDGANIKLYFNGSLESTTSLTGNIDYSDGSRNTIIGSLYPNLLEFTGQIDAVSIFDYALSASQVTTLYGSSSTGIGNPMSLSPKPVAYYPLGDQDSFNGADYLVPNSSLKDYVFSFNGSSQYIDVGNNSIFNLQGSFSVSLWVNSTSFQNYVHLLSKLDTSYTGWRIQLDQTNVRIQTSNMSSGITVAKNMNTATWYHMCFTYDGSYLNYYQNGSNAISNNTSFVSPPSSNNNNFRIGKSGLTDAGGAAHNGYISNVQIFNTALSSTDVETLYNNGSPLTSMTGFTSLQGWWKLDASDTYDSSTGNWTIEDHAGSNDGTSSGMTQANLVQSDLSFTSGYSPYAFDFDGTNDRINLNSTVNLSNSWSVSFWFKTPATTSNNMTVFKGNSTNNEGDWSFFRYFGVHYNKSTKFSTRLTSGGSSSWVALTPNILDNLWHNLVITYNYSSSEYKVYLDGSQCFSGVYDTSTGNTFDQIGYNEANWYWYGLLSNISIWNAALTSAQVREIYSEGVPQNLLNHSAVSSLISWWQLGSNSSFNTNWTVLDEVTASGNNGTSANMTEDDIVDGVNTYGGGTSSGMGGDEVIGSAFGSSANALSIGMDISSRTTDTPS